MRRDAVSSRDQVTVGSAPKPGLGDFHFSSDSEQHVYGRLFKRIFDILFVILVLPIILFPLALLYLAVRSDGGPFLYGQQRIGRDGKSFKCFKIRSMVVDADRKLEALLDSDPELRLEWEQHFKLKNDPRISKVGRILRATSLDELPQLLNVLNGDMSIVGPRPIVEDEREKYGPLLTEYVKVRPGLTGPWQIKGRRDNDYSDRARMDAEYSRNLSFLRDIQIIFATVPEVILAHGR